MKLSWDKTMWTQKLRHSVEVYFLLNILSYRKCSLYSKLIPSNVCFPLMWLNASMTIQGLWITVHCISISILKMSIECWMDWKYLENCIHLYRWKEKENILMCASVILTWQGTFKPRFGDQYFLFICFSFFYLLFAWLFVLFYLTPKLGVY